MADQPNQQPAAAVRDDRPQKPADAGNEGGGKISSETVRAQEEAAKDRAREGGYR